MNKNIIVLVVLFLVLAALMYFYAYPQWKKFHPPAQTAPQQPQQPMPQ